MPTQAQILRGSRFAAVALALLSACAGAPELPPNPPEGIVPRSGFFHYLRYDESLEDVARRYGRSPEAIIAANQIRLPCSVYEGFRLRIPPLEHRQSLARPKASRKAPRNAPKATGAKRTTRRRSSPPRTRGPGAAHRPGGKTIPATTAHKPGATGFRWPLAGVVEREFVGAKEGEFSGLDIAARQGSVVRASRAGKVLYIGDTLPLYGLMIILEHDGGYHTVYANIQDPRVVENRPVAGGQPIASVGRNDKKPSSPHLHFQIQRGAKPVNPRRLLPKI